MLIGNNVFYLEEFVSPATYMKHGASAVRFLRPELITACEKIKAFYNRSVAINTWHWNGQFQYSGYREPFCTEGRAESGHRRGVCADLKIKGTTEGQFIEDAKVNYKTWGITLVELGTVGWVHISVEWFISNKLMAFDIVDNKLIEL